MLYHVIQLLIESCLNFFLFLTHLLFVSYFELTNAIEYILLT